MESILIGLVISSIVPKLLEFLKAKRWAVFIQFYDARLLNRITAIAVSFITAIGVTVNFDPTAGVLTVGGLLPEQILQFGLTWIMNFALQEAVYRRFFNQPTSSAPPRGSGLLIVVLATGLSASCAKAMPIAVAGEKSVRTTVVMVSEQVEPMVCSPMARQLLTSKPCLQLLDALEPATDLAIAYNRALAANQVPDIAATVKALDDLIAAIRAVVPDGETRAAALQHLGLARGRAQGGK